MKVKELVEDSDNTRDGTVLRVMSLEYTEENGSTVVHLFTRDSDGSERHLEIVGHYPSFYVEDVSDGRERRLSNDNRVVRVSDGYGSIEGKDLLKVEVNVPENVSELKEHFDKTWEADVFYENRFAIDTEIKDYVRVPESPSKETIHDSSTESIQCSDDSTKSRKLPPVLGDERYSVDEIEAVEGETIDWDVQPRTCVLDIEVERRDDGEIQTGYEPYQRVTGVTVYDNYEDEYKTWVLENDSWDDAENSLETVGERGEDALAEGSISGEINVAGTEKELLHEMNQWIADHQPDLVSGWNSTDYDIPYLIGRCNELNEYSYVEWCRLNTHTDRAFVTQNNSAVVKGVELFDMMEAFKRLQLHDLKKDSLAYVSKEILGKDSDYAKLDMGMDEETAWIEEPETFAEYNLRDVIAVVKIEESESILDTFSHLRSVSGAKYSECNHAFGIVDMVMLRKASDAGVVLPTSEKPEEDWFFGGYVYNYKAGKHRNVVYPDLACFTPDHEVMTPNGLKKVENLEVGDEIYTLDEETHQVTLDKVTETHEYDYNGEIHNYNGQNIEFSVTPNHNIYTADSRGGDTQNPKNFSKKQIRNSTEGYRKLPESKAWDSSISESQTFNKIKPDTIDISETVENVDAVVYYKGDGRSVRYKFPDDVADVAENHVGSEEDVVATRTQGRSKKYHIPIDVYRNHRDAINAVGYRTEFKRSTTCSIKPIEFDTNNLLKLMAWYVTEGSISSHDKNMISIANQDQSVLQELEELLDSMGINTYVGEKSISFSHGVLREWLKKFCGGNSFEKRIPDLVFEMPLEARKTFLEELVRGDGHRTGDNSYVYYTASERLRDDFIELALSVGEKPTYASRERCDSEYEIYVNPNQGSIHRDKNEEITNYDGKVYCITAEKNHIVYAGKNGRMDWIGQSLYPHTIQALNISPETYVGTEDELKFSPYTKEDCLVGYVDNRPVKVVPKGGDYDKYKNGEYKAIMRGDNDGRRETVWFDEPDREPVYYLKPSVKQGFVSGVVDDLLEMKYEYKGTGKYTAIKVIANAVWGVFGDSNTFGRGFRLFQRELAETITLAGREVLRNGGSEFVDYLHEEGYDDAEIVIGDTDAYGTSIPSASTRDAVIRASQDACEYVNDEYYPKWAQERFNISPENNKFEVELESYAPSIFVPSDTSVDDPDVGTKKTYSQWITWLSVSEKQSDSDDSCNESVKDEGEETDDVEYKGLEVVRSDTAEITQEVQREVLTAILKKDANAAQRHCYEYVRNVVQDCKNGNLSLEVIARSRGISKELSEYGDEETRPTTHIRGAKYADKHIDGENIKSGSKPMLLYVDSVDGESRYPRVYSAETGEDEDVVDAVAVEETSNLPNEITVDYDKHAEKFIIDPLERIFEGMGWSLDEAINNYRQKGLSDF